MQEARTKYNHAQSALETAYRDNAELQATTSLEHNKAKEALIESERSKIIHLQNQLEEQKNLRSNETESYKKEICELQLECDNLNHRIRKLENDHRAEVSDYQYKLENLGSRNEELRQQASIAAQPFMQEIDQLIQQLESQNNSWTAVEQRLTGKLRDTQLDLTESKKTLAILQEKLTDSEALISIERGLVENLNNDKKGLKSQLSEEKNRVSELQNKLSELSASLDEKKSILFSENTRLEELVSKVSKELDSVKLALEKSEQINVELRKGHMSEFAGKRDISNENPASTDSQSTISDKHTNNPPSVTGSNRTAVSLETGFTLDSRSEAASTAIDGWNVDTRMKDMEIRSLRDEIQRLESSREKLMKQLLESQNNRTAVNELNEALETTKSELKLLKNEHDVLLTMYGEKEERVQELKMDLQEAREAYRLQLDEMCKELEKLKKK